MLIALDNQITTGQFLNTAVARINVYLIKKVDFHVALLHKVYAVHTISALKLECQNLKKYSFFVCLFFNSFSKLQFIFGFCGHVLVKSHTWPRLIQLQDLFAVWQQCLTTHLEKKSIDASHAPMDFYCLINFLIRRINCWIYVCDNSNNNNNSIIFYYHYFYYFNYYCPFQLNKYQD